VDLGFPREPIGSESKFSGYCRETNIRGEIAMKRFHLSVTEKGKALKRQFQVAIGSLAFASLIVLLLTANPLQAQAESSVHLRATLSSFSQVPSVLAQSSGSFEAEINPDTTISYTLTYNSMSSPVVQAHIHFGASETNGGVIVFLCGGPKPTCPASGSVSGVITSAGVSPLPANNPDSVIPQGIQPGSLAGLFEAIRAGDTYVNVHTQNFPNGELRGQVKVQ
jgi:hypothetical protein